MKNYTVRRFEPHYTAAWNAFVSTAKNATFLFHRDFMGYHADRFQDYSLLVFDGEKLVALLPANRVENTVYSHQGLTYGGFVLGNQVKLGASIAIIKSVLHFLHSNQIERLQLKTIPTIYTTAFSEEIQYVLFLTQAQVLRRDCLSVIDLTQPFSFSKDRKQCVRRGEKAQLTIREETDFAPFWEQILRPNLEKKHQANPVHSEAEITLLQQKFPENIRHFNVYHNDKLVAGTTVFVTETVAHPQYISGDASKNELGSLDFLYDYLIHTVFKNKHFFDFGPSHEDNGRTINEGILFWKESFGAKTTTQDYYELETAQYTRLTNVMV